MADKKVFLTELTNLCRRRGFGLGETKVFEMKPADDWLAYTVNGENILILDPGDYESQASAPSLAPTDTPEPLYLGTPSRIDESCLRSPLFDRLRKPLRSPLAAISNSNLSDKH